MELNDFKPTEFQLKFMEAVKEGNLFAYSPPPKRNYQIQYINYNAIDATKRVLESLVNCKLKLIHYDEIEVIDE